MIRKIIISAILMSLTVGCSKEIKLNRIENSDKIMAFGDSLTYGYNLKKEESYPYKLEMITGYTVINAGLSGDRAKVSLSRLIEEVKYAQPRVVIISIGGNDMLAKDSEELEDNLIQMISYLKDNAIIPILLAQPKPTISGLIFDLKDAEEFKKVADKEGVLLIENVFSKYLSNDKYKIDMIHLNELGYDLVAKDIAKKLKVVNLIDY